jgi:hypothetical protein
MSQLSQAPGSTNGRVPVRTTTTRQYRDTQVDVELVLCALWIAMLFVFAYVGSVVEVMLLLAIARIAWRWPPPQIAPSMPQPKGVRSPGDEVDMMSETRHATLHVDRSTSARPNHISPRTTARVVGWLFIVATLAGIASLALVQPVLDASDYLSKASASENRLATGVLLELVMGTAAVAIAVVIYPVLRRSSQRLALGFVAARTLEAVIYLIDAIAVLTLLAVSGDFVDAGTPESSPFQPLGAALLAVRNSGGNVILDVTAFSISALILNVALYRAGLVPRWLSVWGLIGAVVYMGAAVMVLYGLEPGSTTQMLLDVPLGVQEMALALWLIIRGFNASAFLPESAEQPVEVTARA